MAHPRRPMIAGNWKMFKTTAEAQAFTRTLAQKLKNWQGVDLPDIVLCPPFTALSVTRQTVEETKAPFHVAAQTMESRDDGAYTGEISPRMLLDVGVTHVIIGHSERREYYNETDATVNAKTLAALKHGLTPIVCVGESLSEREANKADQKIQGQVQAALQGIEARDLPKLVFAYEPIWAIGTGKVCEAEEANRICGLIRTTLANASDEATTSQIRVLYGGSVKAANSGELLRQSDIDGALVGGASLEPDSFAQIIASAIPQVCGV